MRDHHRRLIEEQAEAWKADANLHGTERSYRVGSIFFSCDIETAVGMTVELTETKGPISKRVVTARFKSDEMPLTAQMIRDRFANPFGGK